MSSEYIKNKIRTEFQTDTPYSVAIGEQDITKIETLLANNVIIHPYDILFIIDNIDYDEYGRKILLIKDRYLAAIQEMARRTQDIEPIDNDDGYTPISLALTNGDTRLASVLIEAGQNLEREINRASYYHEDQSTYLWLVEQGLKHKVKFLNADTLFYLIYDQSNPNYDVINQVLNEIIANTKSLNNELRDEWFNDDIQNTIVEIIYSDDDILAQMFIDAGIDMTSNRYIGYTVDKTTNPLTFAIYCGSINVAQLLTSKNVQFNPFDRNSGVSLTEMIDKHIGENELLITETSDDRRLLIIIKENKIWTKIRQNIINREQYIYGTELYNAIKENNFIPVARIVDMGAIDVKYSENGEEIHASELAYRMYQTNREYYDTRIINKLTEIDLEVKASSVYYLAVRDKEYEIFNLYATQLLTIRDDFDYHLGQYIVTIGDPKSVSWLSKLIVNENLKHYWINPLDKTDLATYFGILVDNRNLSAVQAMIQPIKLLSENKTQVYFDALILQAIRTNNATTLYVLHQYGVEMDGDRPALVMAIINSADKITIGTLIKLGARRDMIDPQTKETAYDIARDLGRADVLRLFENYDLTLSEQQSRSSVLRPLSLNSLDQEFNQSNQFEQLVSLPTDESSIAASSTGGTESLSQITRWNLPIAKY